MKNKKLWRKNEKREKKEKREKRNNWEHTQTDTTLNKQLKFNKPFSHVVSIVQISIKKIKTTHNTLTIILTLNKKGKEKKNILGERKKKKTYSMQSPAKK